MMHGIFPFNKFIYFESDFASQNKLKVTIDHL